MRFGGSVAIVIATAAVAAGVAIAGKAIGFVVVVVIGCIAVLGWLKFTKGGST